MFCRLICSVGHVMLSTTLQQRSMAAPRPIGLIIKNPSVPVNVTTWQVCEAQAAGVGLQHCVLSKPTNSGSPPIEMRQVLLKCELHCRPGGQMESRYPIQGKPHLHFQLLTGVRDGAAHGARRAALRCAHPGPDWLLALAAA